MGKESKIWDWFNVNRSKEMQDFLHLAQDNNFSEDQFIEGFMKVPYRGIMSKGKARQRAKAKHYFKNLSKYNFFENNKT